MIDDYTYTEALLMAQRGECPRALYDFPKSPEGTDPHTDAFARTLIEDAMLLRPLLGLDATMESDDSNHHEARH